MKEVEREILKCGESERVRGRGREGERKSGTEGERVGQWEIE